MNARHGRILNHRAPDRPLPRSADRADSPVSVPTLRIQLPPVRARCAPAGLVKARARADERRLVNDRRGHPVRVGFLCVRPAFRDRGVSVMGRKLYVGNLPYQTGETELTELFSRAGTVESARIMRDMATGRARGFGFVEMASDEEAQTRHLGAERIQDGRTAPGRQRGATQTDGRRRWWWRLRTRQPRRRRGRRRKPARATLVKLMC